MNIIFPSDDTNLLAYLIAYPHTHAFLPKSSKRTDIFSCYVWHFYHWFELRPVVLSFHSEVPGWDVCWDEKMNFGHKAFVTKADFLAHNSDFSPQGFEKSGNYAFLFPLPFRLSRELCIPIPIIYFPVGMRIEFGNARNRNDDLQLWVRQILLDLRMS